MTRKDRRPEEEYRGAAVVRVDLGERGYDIRIGKGLDAAAVIRDLRPGGVLIVSDSNVDGLYGHRIESDMKAEDLSVFRFVFPAGEKSKNLATVERICCECAERGFDRSSVIVALGGGVVGDVAGFAAAVYSRGIRHVQVPTSLLAMVDSSVGGKTAVNLPQGKNLVGAFHQPAAVVIDLQALSTLPVREYRAGLAEVVKYGVIRSADFFGRLERDADAVANRDEETLRDVVAECCRIKADVVGIDEREGGVRAILNFGHTLGHAIEAASAYEWLHGEAVAAGMIYAALLSERERGFARRDTLRIARLLRRFGLDPGADGKLRALAWADIRRTMDVDKKKKGGVPRWVLAERMGSVAFGCEVDESALSHAWDVFREGGWLEE